MEVVPKHSTLEANEKGQNIYADDVDSSQISSSPGELEEYPDPDAGKSDDERARLVRRSCISVPRCNILTIFRTRRSSGRWTCG
jgi:hypothetical protein